MSKKKLTEHQRAVRNYLNRVKRVEAQTGKKVSKIKDVNKASTAILNKQTTAVMKRNLLVPLATPKTGDVEYVKEKAIDKLNNIIDRANKMGKRFGLTDEEEFKPEITATSKKGFNRMMTMMENKTKASWWKEKNKICVANFKKSIESARNKDNIDKLFDKLETLSTDEIAGILRREIHTDKTSVAWLYGSEDSVIRERWDDLFDLFGIEGGEI